MLDLQEELKGLVRRLDAAGVPYALCGGLALAVHGFPRATVDIDILLPEDEEENAKREAESQGFDLPAETMVFSKGKVRIARMSKPDPETGQHLSLDMVLVTESLKDVWDTRMAVQWGEHSLSVVSRDGLIALKRMRDSAQDRADIERLLAGGENA